MLAGVPSYFLQITLVPLFIDCEASDGEATPMNPVSTPPTPSKVRSMGLWKKASKNIEDNSKKKEVRI